MLKTLNVVTDSQPLDHYRELSNSFQTFFICSAAHEGRNNKKTAFLNGYGRSKVMRGQNVKFVNTLQTFVFGHIVKMRKNLLILFGRARKWEKLHE